MIEYLSFEPIKESDLTDLCVIHKNTFSKDHFSVNFSNDLLKKYFLRLLSLNNSFSFKCSLNNKIIGYLIGGNNISKSLDGFLGDNKGELIVAVFKNPSFLLEKGVEFFTKKLGFEHHSLIPYRLFLIAVSPDFRSKGVGRKIIDHYENKLSENGINEYGLSVRKNNTKAIRLYLQTGYSEESRNHKVIYFRKNIKERK